MNRAMALVKSAGLALTRTVFPPQCLACGGLVSSDFGLCGDCWRDTPFITGPACHLCGTPLAVLDRDTPAAGLICEACHSAPPPWQAGRAALLYRATGRSLVLALKHGDRLDLAQPMSGWLARSAAALLRRDMLVAPVPLHRWRLFRRQYNQAALLSAATAHRLGLEHCPDLMIRPRATGSQEGRSREARFQALDHAIRIAPRHQNRIRGRPVLLIDDVMTSGATFTAATRACHAAGAGAVCVLALARVAKED